MKKWAAWIPNAWEWAAGSGISFGGAAIMREAVHETIHGIAVVVSGVIGAIAIHFTRKILNKYWPNKIKE